jgi:hypothetical protein
MPTLDLPPSYLEMVRRLLASHVPAAEVWAYGSRIRERDPDPGGRLRLGMHPGRISLRNRPGPRGDLEGLRIGFGISGNLG